MRLEIEVGGRVRTVTVERASAASDRFVVTVEGCRHDLDVRRLDRATLSLIRLDGSPARTSHALTIVEAGLRGRYDVQLREGVFRTVIDGRLRSGPAGERLRAGRQAVTAPMPGRVVRVLVAPGDEVDERQELVVIEAMKMENALGSPKAGRVVEVAVREGMTVEAGRMLVAVE